MPEGLSESCGRLFCPIAFEAERPTHNKLASDKTRSVEEQSAVAQARRASSTCEVCVCV